MNLFSEESLNLCYRMGKKYLNYKQRLEILGLKPIQIRRELSVLKIVFKCIYNRIDVPLFWRNQFIIKNTRNGLMLYSYKTRTNFCDKNFFCYAITLFNSLSQAIRNEIDFKKFLRNAEIFMLKNVRCF